MSAYLFVSTNDMWSGSEELWTRTVAALHAKGHTIHFMARYEHPVLDALPARRVPYPFHPRSVFRRAVSKAGLMNFNQANIFSQALKKISPDLVIISQGDNVSSWPLMDACRIGGWPYATVTQLVAEVHMLGIGPGNFEGLQKAYTGAVKNFFVSRANMMYNNLMVGADLKTSEVVFNPCKLRDRERPAWPSTANGIEIGLVGRVEFFHKGLDLLIETAALPQWRERSVRFNVYGTGPHAANMESAIRRHELNNIRMMGNVDDVWKVWSLNHALLLPSRMEGMALSLIEAMWCGRIAIATAVGGAPDLIEDGRNGFLAEAASIGSINTTLERAWASRGNWKEMGAAAAEAIAQKQPDDEIEYFCQKISDITA